MKYLKINKDYDTYMLFPFNENLGALLSSLNDALIVSKGYSDKLYTISDEGMGEMSFVDSSEIKEAGSKTEALFDDLKAANARYYAEHEKLTILEKEMKELKVKFAPFINDKADEEAIEVKANIPESFKI